MRVSIVPTPTIAAQWRNSGACPDLLQAAGGLVVPSTVPAARGRLALPFLMPKTTAVTTQIRFGGVRPRRETS